MNVFVELDFSLFLISIDLRIAKKKQQFIVYQLILLIIKVRYNLILKLVISQAIESISNQSVQLVTGYITD